MDVDGIDQVTLTGRKPFHNPVAAPEIKNFRVARTLKIAVERNPRQRGQMLGMLREHHARARRHRGLEAQFCGDAKLARACGRTVADRIGQMRRADPERRLDHGTAAATLGAHRVVVELGQDRMV
jgi:hypothetical protein